MAVLVLLGVIACLVSFSKVVPPSRELVIKLGTLVDMAYRAEPERYRSQIEPINPFVGGKFKHSRVTKLLKADLSEFGEICERLQRDARKLDRRAHVALWPVGAYVVGAGLWWALR